MELSRTAGKPVAVLGTAMWSWSIDRDNAFALADRFYERGGRWFDTAANYPINRAASDFGAAERLLAEWIDARRPGDVYVIDKLGSVSNDGTPGNDLSYTHLSRQFAQAVSLFGEALGIVSLHWDDRCDASGLGETLTFMESVKQRGIEIGLSGVRHPGLYESFAPQLAMQWYVQIKNHPADTTAYHRYAAFHGSRRFLAYGLNAGGFREDGLYDKDSSARLRGGRISIDASEIQEARDLLRECGIEADTFNEISLTFAAANPDIAAIIIGPSKLEHLDETFDLLRCLNMAAAEELWPHIKRDGMDLLSRREPPILD